MSDDRILDPLIRARIAGLAEVILPRTATMPSAGDVAVAGELLDRVLKADPSSRRILEEGLSVDFADAASAVLALQASRPDALGSLVFVVAAAYYLSPVVRDLVGYHGQEAVTIDIFDLPAYLEDGSLERVVARGPIFRDAGPD